MLRVSKRDPPEGKHKRVEYNLSQTSSLQAVFFLFVVFQIKHFIADFPLQFPYMLRKMSHGWEFVLPLSMHCGVHALLTLAICLLTVPSLWYLAILDFVVHFIMDRIKSGPRYLGRFNDVHRSAFWIALGFDQMVHHLTHLYIIWMIVTHSPTGGIGAVTLLGS